MNHFLRFSVMTVLAISLVVFIAGHANSDVYTWKDKSGALVFSDDPTLAPESVKAEIWSVASSKQKVTIVRQTEEGLKSPSEIAPSYEEDEHQVETPIREVSQGAFVVQLTRELGLGQNLSPEAAAKTLSDIRISPPLGEWALNNAMTPTLTTRLRALTVSAPQMGWISITPEQALLAFDTAAALKGLTIPLTLETENRDASETVISVPPLVYISPPPLLIASSYAWIPVLNGFSFYGVTVHGYYALHGAHLNAHHFNGHRLSFNEHSIQGHFDNHLSDHDDVEGHVIRHPNRHERHRRVDISPPSHPIRHRQNIVHNRQSHLKESQNHEEIIHNRPRQERHQLRRHIRRQHVSRKSHSISEEHTNAKTHTTSPQHSIAGGTHKGSTGKRHGRSGGHSSISGGGHRR